jgi:two-component system sensor histidine kinase TctE
LLIWLLVPLLVIMPIAAVVQYRLTFIPAKLELDHQLGDFAIAIASFLKVDSGKIRFEMSPETEHLLRTDQTDTEFFLVLAPNGKVLAGDAKLNTSEEDIAVGELRYIDKRIDGRKMRMLIYGVTCGPNPCQVRIAETLLKRDKLHYQALIATLVLILLLGLSTAGVMLFAVRHALRPLQALRGQLADRSLDDLRPLDAPNITSEVQPLVTTLNQLFGRLNAASEAQKAFIADAAHQLRTPLTALQTESELALMEPHPESMHATLERLHYSASRSAKLANQLLTIARTDPSLQIAADFAPVNLKDIGAWAANEWSHHAVVAGIDLGFELASAILSGQAALLQELLSNLIHNAMEHAGKGAKVTVRTYGLADNSILEVEDDGPGIDEEERQKVLQRFFRGRHAKGNGSGLGLAIVNEIARIHSAKISLSSPEHDDGLLVRISFKRQENGNSFKPHS